MGSIGEKKINLKPKTKQNKTTKSTHRKLPPAASANCVAGDALLAAVLQIKRFEMLDSFKNLSSKENLDSKYLNILCQVAVFSLVIQR